MNFPRIGMRNIKTSTSVFLCLLLFELFNRENALMACVAAVICMQNTIVDSFRKGTERIIGTIIGGIAGALVLFIISTFGRENILIFIIPIGIIILIEICVSFGLKNSVVICCVVYLGLLTSREHEGGYILYTINRILDTSVGIVIALLVNKYMNIPTDDIKYKLKISKEPDKDDAVKDILNENNNDETNMKDI
ncbi:aromatic acid exporter family protein [Sedimentibacter sp.]|uniref:aromatic acid exporter family protein n=1 Tax=Sedimentibacter sp. TaxID=1960295 RepID=UPI0028A9D7E5|nr:aromatic acid exporter family protein [Sedimentibacter sp.]